MNPHQHHPRDCPTTRCRYCGPDAEMWAAGELILAPFLAAAQLLWWLTRRPLVALPLVIAGLVAAAVLGAF